MLTIRTEVKERAEAIEANTPLLGVRVGSKIQNSGFTLRKFPTPIRIIIYDWKGNVVSDTTQNGDGADKMDTPLYNVKYYSHNPSATNNTVKYDEEQREVTESTSFVHIRKKPPIIQTIVLPPPPPPPAPVALVSLGNSSGSGALDSSGVPIDGDNPTTPTPTPTVETAKVTISQSFNLGSATKLADQKKVQTVSDAIAYIEKYSLDGHGGDPRTTITINGTRISPATIYKLKESGY